MTEWADELSSFAPTSRSVSSRRPKEKGARTERARAPKTTALAARRGIVRRVFGRVRGAAAPATATMRLWRLYPIRALYTPAHCTHVIHVRFISVRSPKSARVAVGPYASSIAVQPLAARRLRRGARRRRRPRPRFAG